MMKFVMNFLACFLLAVALVSQVIVPMFSKKQKYFWFFRKPKISEILEEDEDNRVESLEVLRREANKNKEERDKLKENLSSAEEVLKEIKSQTH